MNKRLDFTGKRIGRLTCIGTIGKNPAGSLVWECVCECGNTTTVVSYHLKREDIKSCGCLLSEMRHGEAKANNGAHSRLYKIWADMKSRCLNPDYPMFKRYGACGVSICSEWSESFIVFKGWALANGYSENLTIDRKDNDKGYCPSNCRWATREQQVHNRRRTKTTGVSWDKKSCRWLARVMFRGKYLLCATFSNREIACSAVQEARESILLAIGEKR